MKISNISINYINLLYRSKCLLEIESLVTSDDDNSILNGIPSNSICIPVGHDIISAITGIFEDCHNDDESSSNHTHYSFSSSTSFPNAFKECSNDTTQVPGNKKSKSLFAACLFITFRRHILY